MQAPHGEKIRHVLICVKAKFGRFGLPGRDSNSFLFRMTV
jgi:hypothetical protein